MYYHSVVYCEIPTNFPMKYVSTVKYSYTSVLTYECNEGQRLPDGSTWKTIMCGANGTWTEPLQECQGKEWYTWQCVNTILLVMSLRNIGLYEQKQCT